MTVAEACETCGVIDALGRHASMCAYAIRIGLPRLAEDEEPIDSPDFEYDEERDMTRMATTADLQDEPGRIERAPFRDVSSLWFAYESLGDTKVFDATVFDSELDALRHAVERGKKVHRLELGRSLREQVSEQ